MKLILLIQLLCLPAAGAAPWGPDSSPEIMSAHNLRRFAELPLEGAVFVPDRFWSGDNWPNHKGSINYRWYIRKKTGFGYRSPSSRRRRSTTSSRAATITPSERKSKPSPLRTP